MNDQSVDRARDLPVTAIIRRRVRSGCDAEFEQWSQAVATDCQKFAGYLGTRVIQPADLAEPKVAIISFDSYPNYQAWMCSDKRQQRLKEAEAFTEGPASIEQLSGFDYWLGNDQAAGPTWPPKFKMIIAAYVAIWPLVFFISPLLRPYLPEHPVAASLLSSAVITLLMGYISLPLVTRLLRRWLVSNSNK